MIRIKKKLSSRVIAFVTAAVFVICAVPDEIFKREAARAAGSSAENTGVSHYPENNTSDSGLETSDITHRDKLVDNGNGTFTFTSEISAAFSHSDESKNRARTQDGYRVIDREGTYLLELWGGDGGKGSKIPIFSEDPGEPGKGGFVYGTFNSAGSVGKLLYYEVGSNGKSITRNINDGGSGGIGGGAGDITLVSVGAGGGYSAIYLIDKEDLDKNGVIKEEAKNDPDKVLMIAGGGGGGGAGANVLPRPVNKPNGGDGGTIDTLTATAIVTNSDGKTFSGEYYAGKDGTSSGKKTKYTGKGGTDRPGDVNESVLGWFDASSFPNDWLSEYHKECARGAGGAGNLRGGGGGAGFAGGSGGVQLTAIDAENVGGGGGGSSYINTNPGKIIKWNKDNDGDDQVSTYFTDENSNTAGGSVIIRYIPSSENSYEYLKNQVTVSGTVSEYFDIVDSESRDFSVPGSISPEFENTLTLGEVRDTIKLSLTLKPKADFAGGNDVPVFSSDIVCASSDTIKSTLIKKDDDYKDNFSVTHVNVPFNYSIKTNSIVKKEGDKYRIADLIVSETYSKNEFMTKVNASDMVIPVTVTDSETENLIPENKFSEEITATLSGGETQKIKTYIVSLTVNPNKNGLKSVGIPNATNTTISSKAIVQILNEIPLGFDGLAVNAVKNLSYNYEDDTYDLNVKMRFSSSSALNKTFYVYEPINTDVVYDSTDPDNNTCSSLDPGYYRVEAYGGDGGKGGDYRFLGIVGNPQNGGIGGQGAYYDVVLKISNYTLISIESIGEKGNDGADGQNPTDGSNGSDTVLYIGDEKIIAGGGNGGLKSSWGNDGNSGLKGLFSGPDTCQNKPDNLMPLANFPNPLGDGAVKITKLGVKGGYGYGYYSDANNPEYVEEAFKNNIDNISGLKEQVETQIKEIMEDYLKNITISEDFSKYFKVESVKTEGFELNQDYNVDDYNRFEVSFNLPGGTIKTNDGDVIDNYNPIADMSSYITTRRNYSCIYDYTDSNEYSLTVKLKPVDGFLGGNDVPLLDVSKLSDISEADMKSYMESNSTEISFNHSGNTAADDDNTVCVPRNDVTDWANVELDMSGFNFAMEDTVVPVGSVVSAADLVSITNNPAEPASWMSDFVKFSSEISPAGGDKIYKDTQFTLTAGLVPKAPAKKAQVIASVSGKQRSADVTAYVKCTVNFNLVNLVTDRFTDENNHEEFLLSEFTDDEYIAEITPAAGYRLPKTASVQGIDKNAYTVENKGGKITVKVPKEKITGNITISASGVLIPHKVHYLYQRSVFKADGSFDKFEVVEEIEEREYYKNVEVADYTKVIEGSGNKPFGDTPPGYCDWETDYEWIWPEAEYVLDEDGNKTDERISGGKLKKLNANDPDTVVMGDEDLYVVGRFKKINYKLKINYKMSDNSTPPSPYESEDGELSWGDEYSVNIPVVPGYTASVSGNILKGKVNDDDFKINGQSINERTNIVSINYNIDKITQGKVTVYYILCDYYSDESKQNIISSVKDVTNLISTDNNWSVVNYQNKSYYNFSLNEYDNYEVFQCFEKINTDNMKPYTIGENNSISNSKTTSSLWKEIPIEQAVYYVYYKSIVPPVDFVKVSFDPNGESAKSDLSTDNNQIGTRFVVIGETYGYIPDMNTNPDEADLSKGRYGSLPKAAWKDHIFLGWYTEPDNPATPEVEGELVDEETQVTQQEDHTLYAHWKSSDVAITIHYGYAEGVPDDSKTLDFPEDKVITVTYNKGYEFSGEEYILQYEGFAPNMNVVKGVAVKDETINILYSNEIKLFIKIYSSDYEYEYNLSKMPLLREAKFSVVRADNNSTVAKDVGADGEIYLNSKSYNELTKGSTYIIRCTSPPAGFNTYEETFTLEDIVTEKTIFLKPSFELPFTGTVNQIIYYCTGAGIMLLAALLLYKTLKKEKTYDKN